VAVLTDILGDEDHLGDMDFKVAGSKDGITAFQMDIKIAGITPEIMRTALDQARRGRLHILEAMNQAIAAPRSEISIHAPRICTIKIPVDKIGALIGPGGKVIRGIQDETGATISVEDDGTVMIAAPGGLGGEAALRMVKGLTEEEEIGKIYTGKVKGITNFGAFVEFLPGREGLLHISEIEPHRINRVEDVLSMGDEVTVKLIGMDQGKFRLSRKAAMAEAESKI
jgi:polyribonucleotide nucleotidyltransferase